MKLSCVDDIVGKHMKGVIDPTDMALSRAPTASLFVATPTISGPD